MPFSARIGAIIFSFLLACGNTPNALANENARLKITITDAETHAVIPLSKVFLHGDEPLSGLTSREGAVTFFVTPGTYSGYAAKTGYADTPIKSVRVESGTSVEVSVTLSRKIGVIGAVRTVTRPSYDPHRGEISVSARSTDDVASSLSTNPDVFSLDTAGASNAFSINGHAASQSGLLVDGIPVVRPGSVPNLRAFPGGIFDAATSGGGSSAYGQGGTLDLHVPDPTLAYSYFAKARSGSIGQSATSAFARGTIGFLGFSVGHASQSDVALTDSSAYFDETGSFYTHHAASRSSADVLKLRAPLTSRNVLTATLLSSHFNSDDYCLFPIGLTPCGYGPDALTSQRLDTYQVKDRSLIGSLSLAIGASVSNVSGDDARPNRAFLGAPTPIISNFASRVGGYTLDASLLSAGRSHLSLQGLTYTTSGRGAATIGQLVAGAGQEATSYSSLLLSESIGLSDRASLSLKVGTNRATGTRGTPLVNTSGLWNLDRRDRLTASLALGTVSLPSDARQGLSDVASLTFDCRSGAAFGSAPSSSNEASESTDARLSLSHRDTALNYDVSVYHQVLHGALVSGWVGGGALAPGTIGPDYLSDLSKAYSSPAICGTNRPVRADNLVLVAQNEQTAIYDGASVTAKVVAGNITIQPFYSYTRSVPVITLAGTSIVRGSQILGVPLNRFGAALEWKAPSQRVEAAFIWRHVDANNPAYLPAYDVYDVGIAARGRGQLALTASNIFNKNTNVFSNAQKSAAFFVAGVGAVNPPVSPLRPRTLSLSYQVQIGAPSRPTNQSGNDDLLPTSTEITTPQMPDRPSQTPFAVDRNNSECGPEQASLAKAVLDALSNYVASGKYVPVYTLPNGEKAILRQNVDGKPALLISGTKASIQIAIFSCSTFYAALSQEVLAHGGYIPSATEGVPYELIYSPSIGLYVTLDPRRTVRRTTNVTAFSGVAPADPFFVSEKTVCPSELRDAVQYTLDRLKAYFLGSAVGVVDGVTIVRHDGRATWYSLKFDDPSLLDALKICAQVSSLTESQVQSLGIEVGSGTNINYAKEVGFYVGLGDKKY